MTVFLRKKKLNCCQSGKKFYVEFSAIYVGLQLGLKVKLRIFTYSLATQLINTTKTKILFFGISRWNYRPTSPYIFRKLFHFFHKKLFLMFIKTSKCIHSYLPHNSPLDRTLYRLLNYDKKDACITIYRKPIP